MQKYRSDLFEQAFKRIGLQRGDVIIVHNSLLSFGIPSDIGLTELSSKIYSCFRNIIGDEGTLVVPTFNFDFCKGITFDRQNTPSKLMGVFSEYIRTLPDSMRSPHPMQSVSAIGPLSCML